MGRGKDWERDIEKMLVGIPDHVIRLTDPPVVWTPRRMIFKTKGMADFEGGYHGIHVCLEAKEIAEARLNFKSKIKDHQVDRLRASRYQGGMSGLLIRFTGVNRQFGLPALALFEMMNTGANSIKHDEVLDMGGLDIGTPRKLAEFLRFLENTRLRYP